MTYTHVIETVVRRARKAYPCEGNGAPESSPRHAHAEGCSGHIEPGDEYVEYFGESHAYESGTRVTLACGFAFYAVGKTDAPELTR